MERSAAQDEGGDVEMSGKLADSLTARRARAAARARPRARPRARRPGAAAAAAAATRRRPPPAAAPQEMFDAIDPNKDGSVTKEEATTFWGKN